jgi:hypothetical protein
VTGRSSREVGADLRLHLDPLLEPFRIFTISQLDG